MPIIKKIIKISKEEYSRLKRDYGTILDLYIQDNQHYVIATISDLRACGVALESPFY